MDKHYITGEREQSHGHSRAIEIRGGARTIYLGGHTCLVAKDGRLQPKDVRAQLTSIFVELGELLAERGGSLTDIVSMTVYVTDIESGPVVEEVIKATFPDQKFPAAAMIGVAALAIPEIVVEVDGIAVLAD